MDLYYKKKIVSGNNFIPQLSGDFDSDAHLELKKPPAPIKIFIQGPQDKFVSDVENSLTYLNYFLVQGTWDKTRFQSWLFFDSGEIRKYIEGHRDF